jgi:hypothetical protein
MLSNFKSTANSRKQRRRAVSLTMRFRRIFTGVHVLAACGS